MRRRDAPPFRLPADEPRGPARALVPAVAVAIALSIGVAGPAQPTLGQPAVPSPIALHLDYTLDRTEDPESFTSLGGLAAAHDGRLYAVDVVDHRVLRFGPGPDHAFELAWGGRGSAQGLFDFSTYDGDLVAVVLGLAVAADGTVWVADTGNHRVQHFAADGTFLGAWGRLGSAPGELKLPVAIALAPDGTLYVSDAGNRRVQHLSADGRPLHGWGAGDGSAPDQWRPAGIAVGLDGTVTVADAGTEPSLRRYSPTGAPLAQWRLEAVARGEVFPTDQVPLSVAAAHDGTVYATTYRADLPIAQIGADGHGLEWFGMSSAGWVGSAIGGIAVGPDGAVFGATDRAIARFGPAGEDLGTITARPLGYGQVGPDTALAVDLQGRVYAVDPASRRVQVFTPDGTMIREWRDGPAVAGAGEASGDQPFVAPRDVAVAPDGTLYVVDAGANRVRWQSADGARVGSWGGAGTAAGQFDAPLGIAVAPDGRVYVADTGNDRVQAFDADGAFLAALGAPGAGGDGPPGLGPLNRPVDVAVAPDGTLRVVEEGNHRVQVFGRDGEARYTLGAFGATDGQLKSPAAIAVDPAGGTWVADRVNRRLVRWDACGRVIEGWGGSMAGYGYRVGELSVPTGIAIAADGTAYVADSGTRRIQRIAPDGQVTGVWGVGGSSGAFLAEGDIAHSNWRAATPNGGFVVLEGYPMSRWSEFDADGRWLGQHPLATRTDGGRFESVTGIAVAPDGVVVVSGELGSFAAGIGRFTPAGDFLNAWSIHGASGIQSGSVAFDNSVFVGATIVEDREAETWVTHGEVRRYRSDGTLLASWRSGGERGPSLQAFGGRSLFSASRAEIVRRSLDGTVLNRWGSNGSGPGQFGFPCCGITGLAVWLDGIVVAGDHGNQRVQLFDLEGRFLGQWGTTVRPDVPPWPFPGQPIALSDGSLIALGIGGRIQHFTRTDPATWHVALYPNRWLAQRPLEVRRTAAPAFDWGDGDPARGFPRDGFSALVQRVVELPAGRHRFRIRARGGVRAWVDERLVVDDWDGPAVDVAFDIVSRSAAEPHAIRVAYDDPGGVATLSIQGPDR